MKKRLPNNSKERGDEYLARGQGLRFAGRLKEAAVELERAVELSPNLYEACFELGEIYSLLGTHRRACVFFRRAAMMRPGDALAHFKAGLALLGDEEFARAAREFKAATEFAPLEVEYHYHLGLALFGCGLHTEAAERLTDALRLRPDLAKVHHVLGAVYRELGWRLRSLRHLRRAVRLDPHDADLLNDVAETCLTAGERREALEYLMAAVQLQPEDDELMHSLLGTYDETVTGEVETREVLTVLERVVTLNPKAKAALDRMAELYERLGEYEAAARAVSRSLTLNPDDQDTRLRAASVMLRRGKPLEALHMLRGIARNAPNDFAVQLLYPKACYDRGLYHAAELAFRCCIRIAPQRPESFAGMASIYEARGERARAGEHLRQALNLSPEDSALEKRLRALVEREETTGAKRAQNK
jgi:tetratricopeptide (TPR) repeat protein